MDIETTPADYPWRQQIDDILEQLDDFKIALAFEHFEIKWPMVRHTTTGAQVAALEYPSRKAIRQFIEAKLYEVAAWERDAHHQIGGFLFMRHGDRLGCYFTPVYGTTFGEGYDTESEPREFAAGDDPKIIVEELGHALSSCTSLRPVDGTVERTWAAYWHLRRSLGIADDAPRCTAVETEGAPTRCELDEGHSNPHAYFKTGVES